MGFQESFKALADPTRREIIEMLKPGRMSAGEIGEHFDMAGASVSHHLSILKDANLVTDTREGKYIYYELNMTVVEEIMEWFTRLGKR